MCTGSRKSKGWLIVVTCKYKSQWIFEYKRAVDTGGHDDRDWDEISQLSISTEG